MEGNDYYEDLMERKNEALSRQDALNYFESCNELGLNEENVEDKLLYDRGAEEPEQRFQRNAELRREFEERLDKVNSLEKMTRLISTTITNESEIKGSVGYKTKENRCPIHVDRKYTFFGKTTKTENCEYETREELEEKVFNDCVVDLKHYLPEQFNVVLGDNIGPKTKKVTISCS